MGASRYHGGLGPNEFAAVLERGEGVLTAGQNRRLESMMQAISDRPTPISRTAAPLNLTLHVHGVTDAASFQRSQGQIYHAASRSMDLMRARNG